MRFITKKIEHTLVRSASIVLLGGLAAGCSSDLSRFKSSDFADARPSTNRAVALAPASQPYPGDGQNAGLDTTYTGSIARPRSGVSGADRLEPLPAPGGVAGVQSQAPARTIVQQPLPAPSSAASYEPALAPVAGKHAAVDNSSMSTVAEPVRVPPARQAAADTARQVAANRGAGATTIHVREGETLYGLSRRFGVPVGVIMGANGLSNASQLQAGQKIVVPGYAYSRNRVDDVTPTPVAAQPPKQPAPSMPERQSEQTVAVVREPQQSRQRSQDDSSNSAASSKANAPADIVDGRYRVAQGDTLYAISRKTGVGVTALRAANGLTEEGHIRVGQALIIPSPGAPQPTTTATAPVDKTVTSAAPQPMAKVTPEKNSDKASSQVAAVVSDTSAAAPDSTGIGKLRWPVRGRVVSEFGDTGGKTHNDGIDIAVPAGTPVKSAENGVVIYSGDGLKEFGNTVLVRHDDGMVTVYGHASALRVKRGDKVRRGQEIALSGMSGNAERPKLHFEVRKNAAPVDPKTYLE